VELGGFGKVDHVMFELARGYVPDARHEADLVVDEDERCILGSEGLVGTY
jgi:hypothetical protein